MMASLRELLQAEYERPAGMWNMGPFRRTEYAIRLADGKYAAHVPSRAGSIADQWADREYAVRFATMTGATIAAFDVWQLGPDEFTIEAV